MHDEDDRLPQTLSYFILNKLRWRIITGDLQPGQPLRETEIESSYGSSRGPVRESLRMLLQTGLVETRSRRGFRVRSFTADDIRNIYDLRATLEGKVVRALAGHDLTSLCDMLRARLAVMISCWRQNDMDEYFRENNRFHQRIIDFTDNRPIAQVLFYVNEISLPVRYRLMQKNAPTRRSINYHDEIITLLQDGDIDDAGAVTETHILENMEQAMELYRPEPTEPVADPLRPVTPARSG